MRQVDLIGNLLGMPAMVEMHPEILAHHFSEAGRHEEASDGWLEAGRGALRRSALLEAIVYLRRGLDAVRR